MTNPVGTGTANLSINVPIDERALWGRLGFLAVKNGQAKSAAEFQRRALEEGLKALDPVAARQLRDIRTRYYAGTLAALFVVGTLSSWFGLVDDTARRPSSSVRVVRRSREEA